jgi:hypothetical protein
MIYGSRERSFIEGFVGLSEKRRQDENSILLVLIVVVLVGRSADDGQIEDDGKRSTNCTVDRGAGFRRLVPGGPSGGRKFSDSIDRKIG